MISTDDYDALLDGVEPIDKLTELSVVVHNNYYSIGCILYNLKESGEYKNYDNKLYYSDKHHKWKQFCEDKLPISYRTAQYWLNMYRYFAAMDVDKSELQNLGWSKAKELVDATDSKPVLEQLIELAKTMTIGELQAYITNFKLALDGTVKEELKLKKFTFYLAEAQAEHIEDIIRRAASQCDNNMNEGIFKVFVEWFQMTAPVDTDDLVYEVSEDYISDNLLRLE